MKAVLVIDMPSTCEECPCCIKHTNRNGDILSAECGDWYKGWLDDRTWVKPSWCPLRPLPPQKRSTVGVFMDTKAVERGYELGWNACLEEITGEME